jgi:hypothetical protein
MIMVLGDVGNIWEVTGILLSHLGDVWDIIVKCLDSGNEAVNELGIPGALGTI